MGPVQTPNFSWDKPTVIRIKADPNYSDWTKFGRRKMLISVKLRTKYVTRIYSVSSVREIWWNVRRLNQRRSTVEIPGRAWRKKAAQFQIETGVPNLFRCRTFRVLNWTYWARLMKSTAPEPGLSEVSVKRELTLKVPAYIYF